MTPPAKDHGQGTFSLVASDLFFGLGAVILVAVAIVSLNLREVVARVLADRAALPADTLAATADLAATVGPVLLADAQGLHRLAPGSRTTIPLDALWAAPDLERWIREQPLFVIAPQGQDTAFLTFSRAAGLGATPLSTLRLTQDCRALLPSGQGFQCQP